MPRITFSISGLDFEFDTALDRPLQVVTGTFRVGPEVVPVRIGCIWREDGQWQVAKLSWPTKKAIDPKNLDANAPQKIASICANLLQPMFMRSGEEADGAVPLMLSMGRIGEADLARVWFSHRPGVLSISGASWHAIWERIERRVDYDEAFAVQGFTRCEVRRAVARLARVFPPDWVRARYREAGFDDPNADLSPESDGYFPAYHIARAASGALCVDPGWKYLVELGLALDRLQAFAGIERLTRGLISSSGTQHHVCMAAEFAERGILAGLEPETGLGSTRNDLLVVARGRPHQIELKEFSSATPIKRLMREVLAKAESLPERPAAPVVFHTVLLEQGGLQPTREAEFCVAIETCLAEVPKRISAIVVGRRFLDSGGGKIKRDTLKIFHVPEATTPTDDDHLRELFAANYEKLEYPLFGLNAPMHFGQLEAKSSGA